MRHNMGGGVTTNTYSTNRVLRKGKKYRQNRKCILFIATAAMTVIA
jgi:hypothetical protein